MFDLLPGFSTQLLVGVTNNQRHITVHIQVEALQDIIQLGLLRDSLEKLLHLDEQLQFDAQRTVHDAYAALEQGLFGKLFLEFLLTVYVLE